MWDFSYYIITKTFILLQLNTSEIAISVGLLLLASMMWRQQRYVAVVVNNSERELDSWTKWKQWKYKNICIS